MKNLHDENVKVILKLEIEIFYAQIHINLTIRHGDNVVDLYIYIYLKVKC